MKKLIITIILTAAAVFCADAEIRTKTYDFGDITRLSAGNTFQVHVTEGNSGTVKVVYDSELENYMKISYSTANERLSLGMIQNLPRTIRNLKYPPIHVYLEMDRISSIDISGAAEVTFDGKFRADDLDIDISGASHMSGLDASGQNLDLDCSGASEASFSVNFSKEVNMDMSGAVKVYCSGEFGTCEVSCSGASCIDMKGKAYKAEYECSGASAIDARDFIVKRAAVHLSGASKAEVNVEDELQYNVSVASKMTYYGNAKLVNDSDNSNIVKGF